MMNMSFTMSQRSEHAPTDDVDVDDVLIIHPLFIVSTAQFPFKKNCKHLSTP